MTRDEKILALRRICNIKNPAVPLRLRDVIIAIRSARLRYIIGEQGFFMEAEHNFGVYKSTNAQWNTFRNDIGAQNDQCINFLYEILDDQRT